MATEITTVTKDGSLQVRLPKNMQRGWRDAAVSVRTSSNAIVIQRVQEPKPSFAEMLDEIQKAVKKAGITPKDVDAAIRWARRTKNKAQ